MNKIYYSVPRIRIIFKNLILVRLFVFFLEWWEGRQRGERRKGVIGGTSEQRRFRNFEVIRQIRRIIRPIIRRIKNTLSQRSVDTQTRFIE